MTFIDMTNQTLGDLKIIERDYDYGKDKNLKEWNKKTFWKCICIHCGAEIIRQGSILRMKGQNNKCPFCSKTSIKIGQKYGYLTVLSRDFNYKKENNIQSKRAYFLYECECGNKIIKDSQSLSHKKDINCGCKTKDKLLQSAEEKILDLTGKKFGLLTVISRNKEKSSPGQIFWNTKCDCGNNFIVCGKHLKQGRTISCGCSKKSIGEQQIEKILIEHSINFQKEYTISELNNKRFDFAILENNKPIRLIEYDGEQHFKSSTLFGEEEFNRLIKADKEKNEWAKENNIPLVRIPYKYKNKITYKMLFEDDSFLIKS